jgi:hypothetical protein
VEETKSVFEFGNKVRVNGKLSLLTPCCSRRDKLRAGFANDLGARLSNGVSPVQARKFGAQLEGWI